MNEFTLEDAKDVVANLLKQNPERSEVEILRASLQILSEHYNYSVLTDCGKFRILGLDSNGVTVLTPWKGV